jgi:tRNA(Ile2) C34 agmatinyltransferase TiaS
MSDFVTLTCPSCGAKVSTAGDSGRFLCEYCGNEHLLKGSAAPAPASKLHKRLTVPTPSSVHMEKDQEKARLVQRWFSFKYAAMLFFVIPWDAFLCFW